MLARSRGEDTYGSFLFIVGFGVLLSVHESDRDMAGTITALRFQKRNPERVNLYLDGEFAFGLPAIEAIRLRAGQHLSDSEIERLRAIDLEQKTYDRALRFLSYRPRSGAEVRTRLQRSGVDDAVIDAVVLRLQQSGYLDDAQFARLWVEDRERFRPKGPMALRRELQQRGVARPEIDAAIGSIDPFESACDAARAQARRWHGLLEDDPRRFRQRLTGFLARRGFDYEIIDRVLRTLIAELSDQETDFDEMGA